MARLTDRLARGLATVVNLLDPDAIVLGGGLSNIQSLYRDLPPLVERYAFTHRKARRASVQEQAWRLRVGVRGRGMACGHEP